MSSLTAELRKVNESLSSQQQDILSIRDVIIKQLQDENVALKVANLETRIVEQKSRSIKLSQDLVISSKNTFSNDQYMRQNNIEIDGIPDDIGDDNLEKKCIEILEAINIKVDSYEIEDCHRLKKGRASPKTTIMRFVNRRASKTALRNKKKLKDVNVNGVIGTQLYIRENLSWYNKNLAAKCRRLKKAGKVIDTWTHSGLVRVKLCDGNSLNINHPSELENLFPDFTYFS